MKLIKTSVIGLIAIALAASAPVHAQSIGLAPQSAQNTTPAPAELSPAAAEVVKMAQKGVDDSVLIEYVSNSRSVFNLSADGIVYLRDLGISSPVLNAMISHDSSMPSQPTINYEQHLYTNGAQNVPPPQPIPQVTQAAPPVTQPTPPPADTAPTYVGNPPPEVSYFYDDLTPYGSWVNLDGYGWCWQPTVVAVNRTWRPYCDSGHWVYTDAGWYWQSDYSWGWAPFHYGRWQLHDRCGWVWFPDTVWSPAWVTWRYSGDHCGWAPLPWHSTFVAGSGFRYNGVSVGVNFDFGLRADCFTFVAFGNFFQHDIRRNCLPPTRVTQVINNTTIINNYTVRGNNVVVNHGVPVDRVAAATHTQVRTVVVRDVAAGSRAAADAGNRPNTVVRQELHSRVKTEPIVAQKVDNQHPVVRHPVSPTIVERTPAANAQARGRQGGTPTQPQPTVTGTSSGRSDQPGRGRGNSTPSVQSQPQTVTPTAQGQPTTGNRGNNRGPGPTSTTSGAQPPVAGNQGNGRGNGQANSPTTMPQSQPVTTDRGNGRGRGQAGTPTVSQQATPAPTSVPAAQPQSQPAAPRQYTPPVNSPQIAQPQTVPSAPSAQRGNPHLYSPKGGGYSGGQGMNHPAPASQPPTIYTPPPPSEYQSSAQPADNRASSPKSHGRDK